MAEPIGLASGVLALSLFPFKSGRKLFHTIQTFGSLPRQVRELLTELEGLTLVLQKISEMGDLDSDVDLSALRLALEQCKQACDDVEAELLTYCSRSGLREPVSALHFAFLVFLILANRASATTAEAIQACRDLVATTTVDLEAHLQSIVQKLEVLANRTVVSSDSGEDVRQRVEEERLSTEKGIQFCAVLSQQIEQLHIDFFGGNQGAPSIRDHISASKMLLGNGLEACRDHMRITLDQLEKHQRTITKRLGTGPTAMHSAEDRALLDRLYSEANTLRHCLGFCSDVDTVLESQISNIENHAEGDDTIQFMVSTNGKPLNGTNRGIGQTLKQAGEQFGETSLQQLSQDFKSIALHQSGVGRRSNKPTAPKSDHEPTVASPTTPFGDRHGPGFTLAKPLAGSVPSGSIGV
ncbi:uncharacterized protein VDAG_09127 [Verticillium dahliae VdLs.17]|uniref:Azaphilone pigments biosynthesis cluster protein L N-terminal domain-containing protein n=1 Tax=Verticillium dahliae (strain VdLs.17 / ATCC MYA-4575 / FGSC 10137) TaxID=498257 RepID=G2XFK3_VERDV|nr:uncharacterized protein VDAG_09127 [Verticillium dahliae VdLs.17]EGY18601.1 hypothetical protein VDAG_09127 [Verticillium dahliae VdLs.17]KAF3347416.1 Stress-activated map kinase-interacting protein 1 [Verticillium dahliae VDG2]KAH6705831.1 hypothetical protein EV126DRAFT_516706 [Verticillium dahliae]